MYFLHSKEKHLENDFYELYLTFHELPKCEINRREMIEKCELKNRLF